MSWEKVKLGEVASFSNGVNFGKQYYGKGIKLINVSDFGNRISPDFSTLQEVKSEVIRETDILKNGDILFVRSNGNKDLVGRCMLIKSCPFSVTFSGFCIRARIEDKSLCDSLFMTYHFKSALFRKAISNAAVGANIQNLSQGRLSSYEFDLPPLEIQNRIASILSRYDDLIENYQHQIQLLEEAAQRLYKEWFVDLHFPGYENTNIVDGVPEGWEKKKISDVCQTIGGGTPSTKVDSYYKDGKIKWVTPTDITRSNCLCLSDTEKKITEEGLQHSSAKMLPAGTILMTSRASVGYFGIFDCPVCTNQGFISCIPNKDYIQMYLLYNLKSRVNEIRIKAGGATYLEISKSVFRELAILEPSSDILKPFQNKIHLLLDSMRNLTSQIRLLTESRDRLLPKLMSGEITV